MSKFYELLNFGALTSSRAASKHRLPVGQEVGSDAQIGLVFPTAISGDQIRGYKLIATLFALWFVDIITNFWLGSGPLLLKIHLSVLEQF